MRDTIQFELLRAAVQETMFCTFCKRSLDIGNAVLLEVPRCKDSILCGDCWDSKQKTLSPAKFNAAGVTLTVTDSRKL